MSRNSTPSSATYVRYAEADWWIGRMYGRMMPARLRKYLRRSITPEARHIIRQRLSKFAGAIGRVLDPLRTLPVAFRRRKAEAVVRSQGRSFLATVVPDVTPVEAMRRNLTMVCQALDAVQVPYFVMRSEPPTTCVAVPDRYRHRVVDALTTASDAFHLYVERVENLGAPTLATRRATKRAVGDDYFRVLQVQADKTHCMVLDGRYGCDIEFWRTEREDLVAPRANPITTAVPTEASDVFASESALTPFTPRFSEEERTYRTRRPFVTPMYSDVTFPVDVVYTWVDGMDSSWQERRADYAGEAYHPYSANYARFINRDELRYSIRSVRMNMPWVRTIYLVTDQQVPDWLNLEAPGLVVVDHREIFSDLSVLPTFNSHAIESQLHHISRLSEYFIYLNDDVCVGEPLMPHHFFLANGISRYFASPALIPLGGASGDDIPSSVAGKNNRELITEEFGAFITHKMKHAPHALRRSVLAEMEERYSAAFKRTAASRFRHMSDISTLSSLYHYHAFHTGRAVPGELRTGYYDLASPQTPARLRGLLARRDRQVFCLNDTTSDEADAARQFELVTSFLKSYFPIPSMHEKERD